MQKIGIALVVWVTGFILLTLWFALKGDLTRYNWREELMLHAAWPLLLIYGIISWVALTNAAIDAENDRDEKEAKEARMKAAAEQPHTS